MTPGLGDYSIPLAGAVILAGGLVMAKWVLRDSDPASFMFFRSFSAFALSLAFVPAVRFTAVPASGFALLALVVLLVPFLMNLLFFTGVKFADVGSENALLQSTPVFVVLFEAVLLGYNAPLLAVVGVGVILGGVVILLATATGAPSTPAVLLGLGAAAVNGLHFVILAIVLVYFERTTVILAQNAGYAALSTVVFLGGRRFFPKQDAGANSTNGDRTPLSLRAVILLSLLNGFLIQIVFLYLRATSVQRLGSLVTSALVLTQVPITLLLSRLFLKDKLTVRRIVSAVSIVVGAITVAVAKSA